MSSLIILMLALGALLPVVVAVVIVFLGLTKGKTADWPMALAFSKGIGFGLAGGLLVSGAVVGLVFALARLTGR